MTVSTAMPSVFHDDSITYWDDCITK